MAHSRVDRDVQRAAWRRRGRHRRPPDRRGLPRLTSRVSLPGGPASDPVALGLVEGPGIGLNHLLVGAHGTGEVLDTGSAAAPAGWETCAGGM